MAVKKTTKKTTKGLTDVVTPPADPEPQEKKQKDVFAFPTRVRCPRCDSISTVRYSQDNEIQYRRCEQPVCRHTFQIIGKKV